MARRRRGGQAFGRRSAGESHHPNSRSDRGRARPDHTQDFVARDHLAGGNRRHDGNTRPRMVGHGRYSPGSRAGKRLRRLGGALRLSPADDILIRAERALDIDTEGQLIASVLSKKIAAGSTHLIIDMPVGPTAKVRSAAAAQTISDGLVSIAATFGLKARIVLGDGMQPIGHGIGPALEARDVLAVLQRSPHASLDLRARALALSGAVIELAGLAGPGDGEALAAQVLDDGRAWAKFQRICNAQGGMRVPPVAPHTRPLNAREQGRVHAIDNRRIARLAKLAGAPDDKAAGVDLHVRVGDLIVAGQPLCTVHSDSPGELAYAFEFADLNSDMINVRPE